MTFLFVYGCACPFECVHRCVCVGGGGQRPTSGAALQELSLFICLLVYLPIYCSLSQGLSLA